MSNDLYADYLAEKPQSSRGGTPALPALKLTAAQKDFMKSTLKMRTAKAGVPGGSSSGAAPVEEGKNGEAGSAAFLDSATLNAELELMGSLSSLTTDQSMSPFDIVRTKRYDSSAKSISTSQVTRLLNVPTAFSTIDREAYCTPVDRIGRYCTMQAAGLTAKDATRIAKFIINNTAVNGSAPKGPSMIGFSLSSTAPDAFDAPTRISDIAWSTTGKLPEKAKKPDPPKPLPSDGSPLALREDHRLVRSQPAYALAQPRSPVTYGEGESKMGRDFDSWNPEPATQQGLGGSGDARDALAPAERLMLKSIATRAFFAAIDEIVHKGVLTASGSGHRLPVVSLTSRALESIITRIPTLPHFLDSELIQTCLGEEIHLIQEQYCLAGARACVEYDVRDASEALMHGISVTDLRDNRATDLWANCHYRLKEFRIFRQTGIRSRAVANAFRKMRHSLCVADTIMLELHYLWHDATLPSIWWESLHKGPSCVYNSLRFVDVHQQQFRNRLPLTIEDFASHIEGHGKDIRDALAEYWLSGCGSKLSACIAQMQIGPLEDGKSEKSMADSFEGAGSSSVLQEYMEEGEDGEELASPSAKALKARLAIEGMTEGGADESKHAGAHKEIRVKTKAEHVVDSAAVLLSRQLRSMCEASLQSMVDLFEELSDPSKGSYSVFVINLRLRRIRNREVVTDFLEPVEVCLQPDLTEFKYVLFNCVNCVVGNSRNFPRPEQTVGAGFGGANAHHVHHLMTTFRHKKLNESSVAMTDVVVVDSVKCIHDNLSKYYEAPNVVLQQFQLIESLLSGKEAERVVKAVRDCVGGSSTLSTIETLDVLTTVCKDLEAMIESIRTLVPDVSSFPLFEVRSVELKDVLIKQVRFLLSQVLDAVVEENRKHMLQIGATYAEIAETLITEATDSAELKALQDFTNKSAGTLNDLYEQYTSSCFERVKFVLNHKFRLNREDIQILATTFNWPSNIQVYLRKSFDAQAARKRELEELLEEDQRKLENDITDISKRVELLAENGNAMDFRKCVERIVAMKKDLELKAAKSEEIFERETLLEVPHTDQQTRLEEVKVNLDPLDRLWNTVKTFVEKSHAWQEQPLAEIDPEDAERTTEELYRTLIKASRELDRLGEKRQTAKRIAETMNAEVKEFMQDSVPLMLLVCNPGMRERHWTEIENATGLQVPRDEENPPNLATCLEIGLHHQIKAIEDICVSASKEFGLQIAMDKMEKEWEPLIFDTKEYRTSGTRILCGIDEVQMLLDDQIVKTQAMRGSRFIKPFLERCTRWELTLTTMQDILDNWLKVQSTWLYLEPIFSSDDIMRQMPTEGKMFRAVDNTWRVSMAQTFQEPSCVKVARRPGFLESLVEANAKLEQIQKGLNDYLETKRLAFPRFFFLSNDELLEILAETKDPLRVQPHMKKCFDGIAKLHFQNNLDITACYDPKGEKLDFPYDKVNHKKINPNDSGGNVERWLIEVESVMKKSLAYVIDFAMKDATQSDRIEWLHRWQGQVIIACNQTRWCMATEKVLMEGPAGIGLNGYYQELCDALMKTVELVRGDISKQLRVAVGSLVVMDVHNRDTIGEMAEWKTDSKTDFDWLAQLRYYWNSSGESAQSGKPGSLTCCMINASVLYAYEYIGNQDRLVITPLTDRCYRTLVGAIHLNLGGAPEGPAGTGKTETVKDLGKAIAIQCVVTNCSDGLDYLAMAKFFKGLASSGAWACFDEFNRIQLEVLSVVAQQIMQIQLAKVKGLERFTFEGTELVLQPTCCPFITMNPGYAGRAELPDNLKVLFRTVAMMVPDYGMISEIILYSFGYTTAKPLSVKIVTTYKLCSEQLSSQSHYDYGMRAVIAVLRAAGNLKRSDGHLPEDVLVLRSIIDVNLPKFLSPDVPLFNGIVSDLFPGVVIEPPDRDNMKQAFLDVCATMSLIPEDYFWDKVVQIYDMMVVRHGFMIVGLPFSGKSSAWKVLGEMLGLLSERFPDDKRWTKVIPILQNPKSITMGQLYGMFDPVSHEWTDGVLAINYRNAASNKIGEEKDRKWILFDGPVDALWIENMNTVLDDNKKLCLMSGEIIAMTDVMSMMFEPMDLLVASPATVSRCGMIYLEPERLGWKPLLDSWIQSNLKNGKFAANHPAEEQRKMTLYPMDQEYIEGLAHWLIDPCLCFVRKEGTEMSPTVDSNLVMSLLSIFECLLPQALIKYRNPETQEDDEVVDPRLLKARVQDIECCFFFALMWSIGKSGTHDSQGKFSKFIEHVLGSIDCIQSDYPGVWNGLMLRGWTKPDFATAIHVKGNMALPMPMRQDFFECVYNCESGKWRYWSELLPSTSIPAGALYSTIIVPNQYTAQVSYMIELLVPHKKNVLICGPTGTGKSVYVFNTITSVLPQDKFKALCLGFSAKTSANMTQDIIDGKLDKRRKGVYGPPMGQQSIIFVDDLNMPEVETYGAQPPIELLRQLIDNGGWYDLKEKSWRKIVDTSVVSAMGPPGGGRNFVTPRLLRHFSLFCFAEFEDATLRRIFSSIVNWHFTTLNFDSSLKSLADPIVEATLDTYRAAMASLLPTPTKSHYTFNLRDFSRVIQGVLLCKPSDSFTKASLVRLWSHEALRVFGDRLVDDRDREWLHNHIQTICATKFSCGFYDTFKHLDASESKVVSFNDMRALMFGEYMSSNEPKPYDEILDAQALQAKMEEYLNEYNMQSRKPMDLVMFSFAIEHISRISRILKMPGGNALLVGVGGSGRQCCTRLACFMSGFNIFQIEISKNYTNAEWREDLKSVIRGAGTTATPMTFLFSDTQIKNETFVEDINNMLNSGEVPNIFPSDERAAICEAVRPFAKQTYGKIAVDMSAQDLYAFFIQRVKQQMHIVLAFSPIGDAFRDRLRKFPALINCCTIDWFTAWPSDALLAVSNRFLSTVKFDTEETRHSIVQLTQQFHQDVSELSDSFMSQLKRRNYVTPTSYLELIQAYKGNLDLKRTEISQAKNRYEVGLEKLAFAAEQVDVMKKELADLQPELIESAGKTEVLMKQIEEKMPGVMETRKVVSAEAAIAQGEADIVGSQKSSVEADLAEAIPALEAAVQALNTIKPNDINEIKNLSKPPEKIRMVCRAVCIMQDIKPVRIPDPNDPSKRIMDYWGPSQKMLSDSKFIDSLMNFDKDHIDPKIVKEIQKDFMEHPDFDPEIIAKASKAAEGMCRWVGAMVTYDRVAKIVGPKKLALEEAEATLAVTMGALNQKKAALQAVEDELKELEDALNAAKKKKGDLEAQADMCDKKIERANQLLDGLGGERERWSHFAQTLAQQFSKLTGDVLISSGVLAYLGPFTAVFRQRQMVQWAQLLKDNHISCSDSPSLAATLGNPVKIRQWNIDGLPTDSFSIDNGIIVFNARRWPLMIDPQGQANKWIRNMEKASNLQVIKLTDGNYLRSLENSIQFGMPVLLENVGEELDPSLEPLLQKQLFKQGGVNCIRLGDSTVEYSENFRFYITTKLRNPHYLPEVSVKVTLLNFMITPEGLQDQLLGIVVSQERPDLEEQRNQLIVESAENKRLLKEIEDKILHIMSSSSGNILEDESAIVALKESKILSDEISVKQAISEETEININLVRQSYSPVAYSSQVLFFCIADLANIEPVYQYSLSWFIALFVSSIVNSEKGRDVAKRLENLDEHFTYSLYRNVCRSLLEKDKLLFSFLLTSRIMGGKNLIDQSEWFYLLTGGMGMDNPHENPAPDWLSQKNWDAVCRLSDLEKYSNFREDFAANVDGWKAIYDSLTPQEDTLPGIFAEAVGIGRLCALRTIRADKVVLGVQKYVLETMGPKFVKPPPFDLQACYADSSAAVPLVFILSAGSDPMGAVFRAGEMLKVAVDPISLGQGQGPKAEKLIQRAKEKGTWVVLQNCHLAPSWMTTLEKICEELDPDEMHSGFRLWCTTYPSEVFPVAVLQNGVKMTNAPPKGIRANLLGSYNADPIANDEFFNSCSKGFEFRRLIFGLCFFHAVVQERRLYGPLGWNIPYEFNESDLRISVKQLLLFLEENAVVPFKALVYTAGECNYGGRVTDDKDRRTLLCILKRFYNPTFLDEFHNVSPSGSFKCPPDGSRENFVEFIDHLPLLAAPEVFGMHENATLTKDNNDTLALLNSTLDTEGGGGGGGGGSGKSKEETLLAAAKDIAGKTPENFDLEYAQLKYPVLWQESMNTVLCQELIRFNNLLSLIRSSLDNVQKAVKGLVVMSSELDVLGSQIFVNRVPALWKARSYPSLKPLSGYVADQQVRLEFFRDWLKNKPPAVFWLSGFFFTQAFLTGASQNFARRYTIPIDDVVFDFTMQREDKESYTAGPHDGVLTHGLFLEGCRWSKEDMMLADSLPKVLFAPSPVMHWVPYRKADIPVYPHYKCPVYKTSDRRCVGRVVCVVLCCVVCVVWCSAL